MTEHERVRTRVGGDLLLRTPAEDQHWRIHGQGELDALRRLEARRWLAAGMPMPVHDDLEVKHGSAD